MARTRRALMGGMAIVALMLMAAPARAHVTVTPGEVPSSGEAKLSFSVLHGCDGSATVAVAMQIPPGVVSATPQVVPGWEIEIEEGPLAEPVELHGDTVTEGVTRVTWSGGPLPDHHLEEFGMSVRIEGDPGDRLSFPIVQTCEDGENAWIQIPTEGEESDHPAPTVLLAASEGNGHGHDGEGSTEDEGAAEETVTEEDDSGEASAAGSDSDSGPGVVAWTGLLFGVLGVVLGGTALAMSRRRT